MDKPIRKQFLTHWKAVLDAGSLPAGVGFLAVKAGKTSARRLFLLADVIPSVVRVAKDS